jgi:hypothetical protein
MSEIIRTTVADLVRYFDSGLDHLIVSASYEQRAFSIWRELHRRAIPYGVRNRFVCFNENHRTYLSDAVSEFQNCGYGAELVRLNSDQPRQTFVELERVFSRISAKPRRFVSRSSAFRRETAGNGADRVAIDITGFTREALAMLIYLAEHRLSDRMKLYALYHRAQAYSASRVGGWLSQGVREIRNVIGYSGSVQLGGETHLILLPGLEFHRARHIIDAVRPKQIWLGHAEIGGPSTAAFDQSVDRFGQRIEALYGGLSCEHFAFSPMDPFITRDNLLNVAQRLGTNIVCACLNAKPAMIGACLAALQLPKIQLIYAQPIYYNTVDYSQPSGNVVMFQIPLRQNRATPQLSQGLATALVS